MSHRGEKHSAITYLGLCRLFSTTLKLHRPKLDGRYHLILQALQSLLRCLFTPCNVSDEAEAEASPSAFTPEHAADYARILSTMADPTVSSVTRLKEHHKLGLNDETKKARRIAGEHLQYLIIEYCVRRLKEKLAPEMKKALEPGLFAVLSVITIDVMRVVNSALDESGRSVWRDLYEDWKRNGGEEKERL